MVASGPTSSSATATSPSARPCPRVSRPPMSRSNRRSRLLSLPREVAKHPETKEPIFAALGRYGPYVQHGKTYANLGKDDDVLEIGGNRAIDLIIAKESGLTGRRFGGGERRAIEGVGRPSQRGSAIALEGRALWALMSAITRSMRRCRRMPTRPPSRWKRRSRLLAAKESGGGGGGSSAAQGRLLGEHPQGGAITVRQGRFGPYVNHGKTNATLKRDMSPESLTLEEAIRLVEDKEGAGPSKKKAPAKSSDRAKPATKNAASAQEDALEKDRRQKRSSPGKAKKALSRCPDGGWTIDFPRPHPSLRAQRSNPGANMQLSWVASPSARQCIGGIVPDDQTAGQAGPLTRAPALPRRDHRLRRPRARSAAGEAGSDEDRQARDRARVSAQGRG